MLAIKFLSGPKAGQEVLLQDGLMTLGRDASCQIHLPSKSVSKKHAQITVKNNQVEIEDLNSRNGLFYNGKKIRHKILRAGDRIILNDIVFEIIEKQAAAPVHPYFQAYSYPQQPAAPNYDNASAENLDTSAKKDLNFENLEKGFKGYIHKVLLPGVYKLAEWMEFKWVVGFFLLGFVFTVMALSVVPMTQILRSNVEQESKNHAESIAVTIAKINRDYLKSGLHTALNVSYAQRRPGVKKAYIVNAVDGRILAPSEMSHTYPKNSFVHKARKLDQTTIEKLGSSTIGAVVPIRFYNSETGENMPIAYSVVLYDMKSLAIAGSEILSLVIQNLFIACILGFIAFFFLINLIEFPLRNINHQLNESLKSNNSASISTTYQSPLLEELCNHINSALNQISLNQMLNTNDDSSQKDSGLESDSNRQSEMNNLVEIVGFPCLSINLMDETIASLNSNFIEQIGHEDILHQPLSVIVYAELKEHLETLIEQGKTNPGEISFGEITLKSLTIQTTCQIVMGQKEPAYAIVTFMNAEEGAA